MVAVPGTAKQISTAYMDLGGRRFRHTAGRLRRGRDCSRIHISWRRSVIH